MSIWKLKYLGKKNKKHVCNISSNVHFSFQWLCYQNMSYDFIERKKHVSDMATSIQAKKTWVEVNVFSFSFLHHYHIAFSNIVSPLAEQLSCLHLTFNFVEVLESILKRYDSLHPPFPLMSWLR